MAVKLTLTLALTLATLTTACSDDDGSLSDLGEAACADLENGADMQAIANGGVQSGLSRKKVAAAIRLGVADHCPQFEGDYQDSLLPQWLNE